MNQNRQIIFSGDLAEVADYCGNDTALALHKAFAGCVVYIPVKVEGWSYDGLRLSQIEELIEFFGGSQIYIAGKPEHNKSNRDAVRQLYESGFKVHNIALKLGISERRVYQLLKLIQKEKGVIQDTRQLDIFAAL